ncbi:MAG TPA: sodium-translocating pyrophosphatase [Candidatus Limnocylindria bacterium]|nr:sodium-translocating pyrophosphatase [Candidatus Limnocylindria bacterium]
MEGLYLSLGSGVVALAFAALTARAVLREDDGDERMRAIARLIQLGAAAFLRREYQILALFVVFVTAVLAVFIDLDVLGKFGEPAGELRGLPRMSIAYVLGAVSSAAAGYIGMYVAVRANVRTAAKARIGLDPALRVAFASGTVMGMTVVGISVFMLALLFLAFQDVQPLTGYAFGASSIALFARVGGGIYTKAADVGADLVGKVEAGIPEDDPRNPATIADNVGDNVGDVAGMGADLFESYTGSVVAAMSLAAVAVIGAGQNAVLPAGAAASFSSIAFVLPLLVMAVGIVASIVGSLLVRTGENASMGRLLWALRTGVFSAGGLVLVGTAALILLLGLDLRLFWSVLLGLVAGQIVGTVTEYYTAYEFKPTRDLAAQAQTGPATLVIGGMGLGMLSTAGPMLTIAVAIVVTYELAGLYGLALSAVGMLSTLGVTLASDAYGPVADNAGGIAEQAHLPPEVRERTDALDSLGNTTAATGKGFAIGSAVLTALALMVVYAQVTRIDAFDLLNVRVLTGSLIGALMPFVFSALAMGAVGRAAMAMVQEVRRQFREHPGIMDGTEEPDPARAVDISTAGALREMLVPGGLAVVVPVLTGVVLGPHALGGLLVGSLGSGALLALMMANAGGAWDNAKKYIETGKLGGKGSEAHKAAIVGDTIGDPFKDTAGPSLNILLKLMAIVAVVFGPIFL